MLHLGTGDSGGAGGIGSIIGGIGDVINGAAGAISYWSDPWGNTFKALRDAASGLSRDVLPALTSATLPDLNAAWFVKAYAVSFAAAILIAIILVIPQVVRTARGVQAGRDLVDSVGLYFGLFLVGAMFGPAFGMVLVKFFHAISDDVVAWGIQSSINDVIAQFQKMIASADPVGITGGLPIAVLLMLCMLIGLLLVFLMLIVQLVTLYFTGVLLPLGLVWIIDPAKRSFGTKIISVWVGILAAHPLLFFLLGFAFTIMGNSVSTFGNNASLQSLVTLSVAVIALFVAALSPLLLLKFAPIIPGSFGGTKGPALSTSSIGSRNMTDAGKRFEKDHPKRPNNAITGSSGSSEGGGPGAPEHKTLARVSAARAGATGAGQTAGAAAGSAAARATTTGAAEGLAAAGAAESATGAGAAVGIPTLVIAAGAAAATHTLKVTEAAGKQATSAMDESTIGADHTS